MAPPWAPPRRTRPTWRRWPTPVALASSDFRTLEPCLAPQPDLPSLLLRQSKKGVDDFMRAMENRVDGPSGQSETAPPCAYGPARSVFDTPRSRFVRLDALHVGTTDPAAEERWDSGEDERPPPGVEPEIARFRAVAFREMVRAFDSVRRAYHRHHPGAPEPAAGLSRELASLLEAHGCSCGAGDHPHFHCDHCGSVTHLGECLVGVEQAVRSIQVFDGDSVGDDALEAAESGDELDLPAPTGAPEAEYVVQMVPVAVRVLCRACKPASAAVPGLPRT